MSPFSKQKALLPCWNRNNQPEILVNDYPQGQPLDELFIQLKAPLLLLWGNRDPWMNAPGKRETFKRYTPKATTEVILDAGHCPHDEVPAKVNQALLHWMQDL